MNTKNVVGKMDNTKGIKMHSTSHLFKERCWMYSH